MTSDLADVTLTSFLSDTKLEHQFVSEVPSDQR